MYIHGILFPAKGTFLKNSTFFLTKQQYRQNL